MEFAEVVQSQLNIVFLRFKVLSVKTNLVETKLLDDGPERGDS